eukprot:354575-Chlamydomonas_euryale.AAC.18
MADPGALSLADGGGPGADGDHGDHGGWTGRQLSGRLSQGSVAFLTEALEGPAGALNAASSAYGAVADLKPRVGVGSEALEGPWARAKPKVGVGSKALAGFGRAQPGTGVRSEALEGFGSAERGLEGGQRGTCGCGHACGKLPPGVGTGIQVLVS